MAPLLSIIGTLLLAFSIGSKVEGGSTVGSNGKRHNFVYFLHPLWFKFGIVFVIIGFLLQA